MQANIPAPTLTNGATVHGIYGDTKLRHPWELRLFWLAVFSTIFAMFVVALIATAYATGDIQFTTDPENEDSLFAQFLLLALLMPAIMWILRALTYADPRANGVRMSPTQFPEGYRMVVEAAAQFGLRKVPDAYVVAGNGVVNAYASGHGFRRFVVVHSDIFEIGGAVRDPNALRFVIGHEVGHLAAGHVSYFRLILQAVFMNVPLLGSGLSRAQEYTADNYGFSFSPQGAGGVVGLLSAGKYLNANVNVHEMADRAAQERGLWLHLTNALQSHPVLTWRASALRDRTRPGKLLIKPGTPWFTGPLPAGSAPTEHWPNPLQVLEMLNAADTHRASNAGEQFGRYPGVDYSEQVSVDQLRFAQPIFAAPLAHPPVMSQPAASQPATSQPATSQPATSEPHTDQPHPTTPPEDSSQSDHGQPPN